MIIGLTGKKRVGKDAVANILRRDFGFRVQPVAKPLKRICAKLFRFPNIDKDKQSPRRTFVLDDDIIDAFVRLGLDREKAIGKSDKFFKVFEQYIVDSNNFGYELVISPREVLQKYGTELCRGLDKDIWLELLKINPNNNIVVPDVRFNNEAKYLCDYFDARIVKVSNSRVVDDELSDHISEKGVSRRYIEDEIFNEGTLKDLREDVHELINDYMGGLAAA